MFLYTALFDTEIYLPLKFGADISYIFGVMLQTKIWCRWTYKASDICSPVWSIKSMKNYPVGKSSPHSGQLLSALSSAYVLRLPVLQTIWTHIRLLPSGAVWWGFILLASLMKVVWSAFEFEHATGTTFSGPKYWQNKRISTVYEKHFSLWSN